MNRVTKFERKIMGLAASQARFLAITSRKMNCEFQSMQIAQQKLSVTRDLQKAAQDYQTNLTATKLVWEDMNENTYDLTYDMMMTPTAINQYDPYLVTDTRGKVVLTDAMYNAAVAAGIIERDTGKPKNVTGLMHKGNDTASKNDGTRDAFLYQLGIVNKIDGSTVAAIQSLGKDGYTRAGVGGEIQDKSIANALTSTAFINYLGKTYKDIGVEPPYKVPTNPGAGRMDRNTPIYGIKLAYLLGHTNYSDKGTALTDGKYCITKNGEALSKENADKLTLGDILSGNYELSYKGTSFDDLINKALGGMAKLLGKDHQGSDPKGLNVDPESDDALTQAYEFTKLQYNNSLQSTKDTSNIYDLYTQAQKQNNKIVGTNNTGSVSLTNMLKSFLTNFAIAIDGFDSAFVIKNDSSKDSTYATDDLSYYFLLANDGAQTEQTILKADFYNMLYNQICMNGACSDATTRQLVEDKEYLSHALKNGQLFISSLNNDGYFYQGPYTLNGHVAEVPDENAIAQAELEYNVTKSKLNYKEETLELQMKNLDMEISALTTEFDTVKNLISKGVEKVFTMFSN